MKGRTEGEKNAPAGGRGWFGGDYRGGGIYLPFFFAAGFAALLVVFFETGFFAAAMGDLLSWIKF
jgi:hypothetical protein